MGLFSLFKNISSKVLKKSKKDKVQDEIFDFIFGRNNWKLFNEKEKFVLFLEGKEKIIPLECNYKLKIIDINHLPPYNNGPYEELNFKTHIPYNEYFIKEEIKKFSVDDYNLLSKHNPELMRHISKYIPLDMYKQFSNYYE
tara:strand:- start:135 stop:557 length:423 start_codon:yes stop_codon:yes gene_type:complete